jgi:hypothetical protein
MINNFRWLFLCVLLKLNLASGNLINKKLAKLISKLKPPSDFGLNRIVNVQGWVLEKNKFDFSNAKFVKLKYKKRLDVKKILKNKKPGLGYSIKLLDTGFYPVFEYKKSQLQYRSPSIIDLWPTHFDVSLGGVIDHIYFEFKGSVFNFDQYKFNCFYKNLKFFLRYQQFSSVFFSIFVRNEIRGHKWFFKLWINDFTNYLNRSQLKEIGFFEYKSDFCIESDFAFGSPYEVKSSKSRFILGGVDNYKNVIVQRPNFIIKDDYLIIPEPYANLHFNFTAGFSKYLNTNYLNDGSLFLNQFKLDKTQLEGYYLSSRYNQNWFHWVIDALPRLFYSSDSLKEFDNKIDFFVPSDVPLNHVNLLQFILGRNVIQLDSNRSHHFSSLHFVKPVTFNPDHIYDEINFLNVFNQESLLRFAKFIQLNLVQKNDVYPHHENIFVIRRSLARGVVNLPELENFLLKSGFFVIDPSSLNYMEQVSLFSSAKRVIMLGGAAMANIVFMQEGSKLLTIQSQFLHNFRVAQDLSEIFSVHSDYFFGTELFSNKFITDIYARSHKPYKIDLGKFSDFVLDWF